MMFDKFFGNDIHADERGVKIPGEVCRPHNNDVFSNILKVGCFNAVLRSSGKSRTSWWFTGTWVRKHHGDIDSEGIIHRDGSNLLPSIWGKEMVSSESNLPQNTVPPTTCVHTYLHLMAKYGTYPSLVRSGPCDHSGS